MLARNQIPSRTQDKAISGSLKRQTEDKTPMELVRNIQVSATPVGRSVILILMLAAGLTCQSTLRARADFRCDPKNRRLRNFF
jgi:hypothetical protein